MNSKSRCCRLTTIYGFSLRQGVTFVGITTTIISVIALITSVISLKQITGAADTYNNHPVVAVNLLFSLFSLSISCYQILLSALLLLQALWTRDNMFLCWLWYVSHLSILLFSGMFFSAKTIICFSHKEPLMAVVTLIAGIIYEGLFIYFSIIVNSFINLIDDEVYY